MNKKMKKLSFNKILLSLAAMIFIAIVAATAVLLCAKNAVPGAGLRKIESESLLQKNNAAFDLIGLLRISTKIDEDQIRHILVVNPWLEYDKKDQQLYEELDRKLVAVKAVFSAYFSSRTKNELVSMTEEQIKNEILGQINSTLVLGKISRIYFKDYIFLN